MDFDITFGYSRKKTLFENLHLSFSENKITVICGHNGAGKTTLLKTITGILPSKLAAPQGWYVPASGGLIQHFSLKEHLQILQGTGAGSDDTSSLVTAAYSAFGASEFEKKKVTSLSTGQVMMASIIIALASGNKFILLDEPFGCLDPVNAEKLTLLLKDAAKCGKTIIVTAHDLYLTTEVADKIIFIKDGKISWSADNTAAAPLTVEYLKEQYALFA